MNVFVAGGNGAVGSALIPRLLAAGHEVVATSRSPQGAAGIERLGATGMPMDGLDQASVLAAVGRAQPEAIVHEMTALAGKPSLKRFDRWFAVTNRLRIEGTDNLLLAAERFGVGRFLAQGYTGWSNQRTGGPVKSEEDPLDPEPPKEMRETMRGNQYLERRVVAAGGLVLRYGSLYGPNTSVSTEFVELARKRRLPIIGDGGGIWSFCHVEDAAAATLLALERGEPGVYNIVDDEPAPVAEWLPVLAERSGAEPPRRLPEWLGRLAIGEVGVSMMTRIRGSANEKAKRELGWKPAFPTWRAALGPVED